LAELRFSMAQRGEGFLGAKGDRGGKKSTISLKQNKPKEERGEPSLLKAFGHPEGQSKRRAQKSEGKRGRPGDPDERLTRRDGNDLAKRPSYKKEIKNFRATKPRSQGVKNREGKWKRGRKGMREKGRKNLRGRKLKDIL